MRIVNNFRYFFTISNEWLRCGMEKWPHFKSWFLLTSSIFLHKVIAYNWMTSSVLSIPSKNRRLRPLSFSACFSRIGGYFSTDKNLTGYRVFPRVWSYVLV